MKVDFIQNLKQITAEDGMFLCNKNLKAIRKGVLLGSKSNESSWQEITEEEKTRLEAEWDTEPTENEATEADYISALEDLGVNFNG